jgi:hypothetical protein
VLYDRLLFKITGITPDFWITMGFSCHAWVPNQGFEAGTTWGMQSPEPYQPVALYRKKRELKMEKIRKGHDGNEYHEHEGTDKRGNLH